jgi:spermidine/putrescine transport system substrate-binding protein
MSASNFPDPSLVRGLTRRRFDRRDLLRAGGIGALGMALAACGVKGKGKPSASVAPDAIAKFWGNKTKNGHVDFANWPLYMDPKHPELKKFTAATGITVNYQEVIQEMGPWFAKVQPQLSAGQSIGYDLMVITNSIQFGQFVDSGFLAPLDHSKMPNFAKYAGEKYKKEAYDNGNVYSVPWTSGITGIAYDPKHVDVPPTKIADLWNTKYKGKVGMFSDPQELGNFGMMALGINPDQSTEADWAKAAAHLKDQKSAGIVRKYYDQGYIEALSRGEVWITQAWSGDIYQKNVSDGTDLKFVIPQDGGTLWTDNMTIPITAKNPVDALELLDFFYQPEIAASLAQYISYVSPVPDAKQQMAKNAAAAKGDDKKAIQELMVSPEVFPTDEIYNRLHYYVTFKSVSESQTYNKLFEPIVLG